MLSDRLKALLVPAVRPILSGIHRLKDAHKGDSCYLFGNGISLKWFDLSAFGGKISIGCSYIPFHRDFRMLDARYMLLAEPWWFYPLEYTTGENPRYIRNRIQSVYRDVIRLNQETDFFVNISNYPVLHEKNITYVFRDIYDDRLPIDFITRKINCFEGSLRMSILLAVYMGFSHCFLVGYDYTHVPSRSLHFYEKGTGVFCPIERYNQVFFQLAKQYIDITTITLDGSSEYLDAVTYRDYTGKAPVYRENTELVDEKYLNVLSTWPGYTIF